MSNEDHSFTLLHSPDNVGYRLIELPPDLQSILESDNPPVLSLESASDNAVLKSGDKSWNMRQKNTSNALMLLSTREQGEERRSLVAVSTLHETVELEPVRTVPKITPGHKGHGSQGKWHERFGYGR